MGQDAVAAGSGTEKSWTGATWISERPNDPDRYRTSAAETPNRKLQNQNSRLREQFHAKTKKIVVCGVKLNNNIMNSSEGVREKYRVKRPQINPQQAGVEKERKQDGEQDNNRRSFDKDKVDFNLGFDTAGYQRILGWFPYKHLG
ncbi:hypothetical protein PGTUg99_003527 [Puccinia graminis f. sp. tritici]|uniref:Uncharacterized protein n=1 Tax=Puccinia graminis f. sp. tritici TaxID=56615 RepID=A0A5B0S7B4_PUCGR|nr:hypothetical protein PGTUg99_003527 [Puccinia graminis f. sp. tritici]